MITDADSDAIACRIRQENAYSAVEEANRMFYVAFQTADLKASHA